MFVKDRRMVKSMSECGWMMFNVGWSQLYVITKIKPWASLSILTLDPSSESLSDSIVEAFFSELVAPNAPANSGLIKFWSLFGVQVRTACPLWISWNFPIPMAPTASHKWLRYTATFTAPPLWGQCRDVHGQWLPCRLVDPQQQVIR